MLSAADFDLEPLARVAAELATDVGRRIREMRDGGVGVAATKSSRSDVVTEADRQAERLIAEHLAQVRPQDGILGEEGASTEGSSGITWVVDPIDGTVNYLYGLPGYAVSIAATVSSAAEARGSAPPPGTTSDGRRAVAGAVYVPVTDELYVAHEGGGATLNGEPIRVSTETELELALVATGFGYTTERRAEQAQVVRQLIPRVRDVRRMGAASVDLCSVASGRLDAYYERGLHPWDYAAGALIAREAGAAILALGDDELPGESMLIVGPPKLAAALREAVRDAYAGLA